MRALAFSLLLWSSAAVSETIFIIQSYITTDIYKDSIIREVKRLRPEAEVRALFVRNFSRDQFTQSKTQTVAEISRRAEPHDNLIVLGYDVAYVEVAGRKPIYIPVLLDSPEHQAPASLRTVYEQIVIARAHIASLSDTVFIINDNTNISQLRFDQFNAELVKHKTIKLVPITVKDTIELRKALLSLNREESSIVINNTFLIHDSDSLVDIYSRDIDRIIANMNRKHMEIGVLKPEMVLAVGFGSRPSDIAAAVLLSLSKPSREYALDTHVGINLDRVLLLGLSDYAVRIAPRIGDVTVEKKYEY